ncbi:1373_t:CDS:2 [Paraglomus brasilianum]|uniref:1373_t:CDS:1 n=1 Tax=Paraglomus brasilianum TaxID=144538 RepID=A0A9N8ZJ76_9GLOM|nr:1373_t:CDS:2 [Paraglomus brasilianum]
MPHATEIPANDPTHMESSISSPIPIPSIPSRTHAWNEQPVTYTATAPTPSSAAPIETTASLEYNPLFLTSLLSSEEIPIDVYGGSYSSDEIDDQLYQASSLISDPKKFEDPSYKCCGLVLEGWQALYRHSQIRHSSDNLPVEDWIGSVTPNTEVFSTSPYLNLSPQSSPKTPRDGQSPQIGDVMETSPSSTVTALASSPPATKKSQHNAAAQSIAQGLLNNYQRAESLWALENCNPHNITCQRQLSQSLTQFDSDNAMELIPALAAANQQYVIPGLLHQSNIGGISMASSLHNVAGNASVGIRFSDSPLLSNIGTALVDYNDPQRRRSAPSILPSTTTQYPGPIDLMSVPYTPNYASSSAIRQIAVSPTTGYPASEDVTPVSLSHASTLTTRCELNNLTSPTSAPSSLSINTRFTNIDVLVASPTEICRMPDHDITSTFAFNSSTNSTFAATGHNTVSLADVYSGPPGTSKPSKKKSRNTAGGHVSSNTCWIRNNDMNTSRNEQGQDAPVHAPRGLKRTQSCPTDSTTTVNKRRTMQPSQPVAATTPLVSVIQSSPDASAVVKTSTVAESEASKPFRCTVVGCPKTYKNANGLKYHKAHGHSTQAGNGDRCAEKPYKCDIDGCTKAYKNPNGLKYHLDHHHPGYIKPTNGLKYHLDQHNSGRGLQVINTAVVGAAQQIPISQ